MLVLTTGGTIDKHYFDALSAFQIADTTVRRILEVARVTLAFRRFVATEHGLLQDFGTAPTPRAAASWLSAATALRERLRASSHRFHRTRHSVACTRCFATASASCPTTNAANVDVRAPTRAPPPVLT